MVAEKEPFQYSERLGRNIFSLRHEWLLLKRDADELCYDERLELKQLEIALVACGGKDLTSYQKSKL